MSERLPGGFEMELERWRSIFDAMPEGVVLLLRDGTIVEANRATEYIVGKKREEILGEKCFVVIHGEKGHAEGCPLLRSLSTGVRERMEMEVDGKVFLVTCDPIRGKEGIIEGFVHIIRDVTEEKKMQKELEEKEALYKAIFEHTGPCMLLVEEDTTISLANEMAARYAGYPKEELQGRSWMEFVAEKEDLEKMKVYHALRRNDPQAVPQSYEFKVRN